MNVVCIGAHPDDCEVFAGGTAVKWARKGFRVLFVSLTNGAAGHYEMRGRELAMRRLVEARESAVRGGVEALVLSYPDGELEATLDVRKEVAGIIRRWEADVVLTHRPNDYHPDHRYTSISVQDAAFMVTVPAFCPETRPLPRNPVFFYFADSFTKPAPFHPDVAVEVDDVMAVKWSMLDAMESQFYEWLPWIEGELDQVPQTAEFRKQWLVKRWTPYFRSITSMGGKALAKWYGPGRAKRVRFAEAFELCEYGRCPNVQEMLRLFPFLPKKRS